MKKNLLIICLVFCVQYTFGQYNETIRSARPGQAFGPFTTGINMFQIQTGFNYGWADDENNFIDQNGLAYDLSLRYGIGELFELRSIIQWRTDNFDTPFGEFDSEGISAWLFGVRYNIRNNIEGGPALGLQTELRLNVVDDDYSPDRIAPRILLLHSQSITDNIGLTTNWGVSWNGFDNIPTGFYVVNIAFGIAGPLGGFIENYGDLTDGDFDTRFDTGLAYLINNDLQLDLSFGLGQNDDVSDYFIDGGVSWRFQVK